MVFFGYYPSVWTLLGRPPGLYHCISTTIIIPKSFFDLIWSNSGKMSRWNKNQVHVYYIQLAMATFLQSITYRSNTKQIVNGSQITEVSQKWQQFPAAHLCKTIAFWYRMSVVNSSSLGYRINVSLFSRTSLFSPISFSFRDTIFMPWTRASMPPSDYKQHYLKVIYISVHYTGWSKKVSHQVSVIPVSNYWPVFNILPLAHSATSWQWNDINDSTTSQTQRHTILQNIIVSL